MKKIIPLLILIFFYSCMEMPKEFVAPEFSTEFAAQVMKKTYTLKEIIERDSSNIRWYNSGNNNGIVYYYDKLNVDKFEVEDNIKVDPFSQSVTQTIGNIKVYNLSPINTTAELVDLNWHHGTGNFIIPTIQESINRDFDVIAQFKNAVFSEEYSNSINKMNLRIKNNLPIPIVFKGLQVVNKVDDSVIIQKGDINNQAEWVYLNPAQETTLLFSLANKVVKDLVSFRGTLYSVGSSGQIVTLTDNSNISFEASFSDELSISSALTKIPDQLPVTKSSTISVDDSTKITNAVIEQGSFSFDFANNLNIDLSLLLAIPSIKDKNGNTYLKVFNLPAKANLNVPKPDLNGWSITPNANGEIEYSYAVTAKKTDNYVNIDKNDYVAAQVNFSKLIFNSINGQIKPTKFTFDIKPTKFDFEGGLQDKISYSNLIMKDAKLKLNLKSSADVDIRVIGELNIKYNKTGEIKKQNLEILIPSNSPTEVDISNLISSTSGKLPDEFFLTGYAIVNPFYKSNVTVRKADTVGGFANIELPIKATIQGGTFTDTLEIDDIDLKDEDAERLEYAELTIDIMNKMPFGATLNGKLIDEKGSIKLNIPPAPVTVGNQTQNYFSLLPAKVNQSGDVTEGTSLKQIFRITSNDLKKLNTSKKIILNLSFNTASSNDNVNVKLKYTDEITITIKADSKINVKN